MATSYPFSFNASTGAVSAASFSTTGFVKGGANSNPNTPTNYGLQASGSYGGGLAFIDGTGNIGLYSTNIGGNLNFAFGSSGSMSSVANISSTGIMTAASFSGAGTGLSGTASSLSIGGSAGSLPLTSTYVGFGSSSNLLTGSSNLTWSGSALSVTGSGLFTTGVYTNATTGATRGILNANGDFLSYYAAETTPRVQIGRDTGISGGAGIALGGSTYALIASSDTSGTALYFKLSAAVSTASTSPNMALTATGLGIGTPSPGYKLSVAGDIAVGTEAVNGARGTLFSGGTLQLKGADNNHRIIIRGSSSVDSTNVMTFIEYGALSFNAGATSGVETNSLYITSAGGVAFGSTTAYGTSGQVLQSNGNAAPTWINQSSIAAGTATDSTKLPLAGGTMTGNILFGDSGLTKRGIEGTVGANDYWFVGGGATATNSGWMEIATGDDAQTAGTAEPIMASQYGPGDPLTGTLVSRAFLATRNSNTTFPNNFGIGFNKTTAPYSETEPSAKLHVTTAAGLAAGIPATSGTTFNGIARFQPNNATYGETLDFGMNVSSSYGWIQATNYTNLAVNYPLLLNPNGGNVGIGTTAPVSKLHVVGSVATGLSTLPTGSVVVQDQTGANNFYTFRNTADNGTYAGIVMQDNNVGGFVVYGNAGGAGDMLYVAGYGGGQLMYGVTDSPLPSGRTAMLTWSSSGVDINNGTSHLGYTLGVNGSAYASSGMYTGNGYGYGGYNGSSVINQQLPNTGGSAQWIFLGTWSNAGQGGAKLRIRIAISQGYNAAIGQDATYEIYFKTSNGSSAQSGSTGNFYGDGYCYRSGFANVIPTIQIVQIDANTYSVYAYTNNFSGSPVASIEISQGNWTSSYSFSSPSGNYITLAQYLTIDTNNISNYSAWTSYTPSTSGFSSISISSAAYQQIGNTVFFNVYFTTSGGTGLISLPSSPAVHMGAMWYYQAGVGTAPTDYGAVHLNTNGYMYMSGLDSNGQGPGYYFYITGFYHV